MAGADFAIGGLDFHVNRRGFKRLFLQFAQGGLADVDSCPDKIVGRGDGDVVAEGRGLIGAGDDLIGCLLYTSRCV